MTFKAEGALVCCSLQVGVQVMDGKVRDLSGNLNRASNPIVVDIDLFPPAVQEATDYPSMSEQGEVMSTFVSILFTERVTVIMEMIRVNGGAFVEASYRFSSGSVGFTVDTQVKPIREPPAR